MTAPWHLTAAEIDAAWDDMTARLAEAEYAKAGLEGAVRIVDARVNKALNILDLIDTDGDDHYYSNADHARMILRGIVTMSEPFDESANRPAVESLRARLAEAERDAERYRYLCSRRWRGRSENLNPQLHLRCRRSPDPSGGCVWNHPCDFLMDKLYTKKVWIVKRGKYIANGIKGLRSLILL